MFDTSNAFAVRGTTIPPLLWDTFQEAVAQDMQARARKEGHIARMPSINPGKPPPKTHAEVRHIIKAGKSVTKAREKRYAAILAAMTENDMTAVQIVDNMGGNYSARSIAESLRYIAERGQVKITKGTRKDIPHTYTRITYIHEDQMSDTPKLWRDMTPEEKGALLLARHEGKVIEYWSVHHEGGWIDIFPQGWFDDKAYRVKPDQVEAMVYAAAGREGFSMFPLALAKDAPHLSMRISFPSLGGRIVPGVYTSEAGHVVTVEDGK